MSVGLAQWYVLATRIHFGGRRKYRRRHRTAFEM